MKDVYTELIASVEDQCYVSRHDYDDILLSADVVVLTGVGKSYEMARVGASQLRSVGVNAQAVHATDFLHGCSSVLGGKTLPVLIALSHSGQTREVLHAVLAVNQLNGHTMTIAITHECVDNELSAHADRTLWYACERDGSTHGTIPSYSLIGQLLWLNRLTCDIADTLPRETLKAGHPKGVLYGHA